MSTKSTDLLSHSIGNEAARLPLLTEKASALNQIQGIFQKVKTGAELSSDEAAFLRASSKADRSNYEWAWSFIATPSDEKSVQEIDGLADKILERKIPGAEVLARVEHSLLSSSKPTARETASLSKLVLSCISRDNSFERVLASFCSAKGRAPQRAELIRMVADFNKEILPRVSRAGIVIGHVDYVEEERVGWEGRLEVRYDADGYLQILDGPVAPLDTRFQQRLTQAQSTEMDALYRSLSDNTPYNNLGMLLEFMKHYQTLRSVNPQATLNEAFNSYRPDLVAVFDKYKSGNCNLLAVKFCHELAARGIHAQCLATTALNNWSGLPIPGSEATFPWKNTTREARGVDHTDVVSFFHTEQGTEKIVRYRCSFEKDLSDEVSEFSKNRSYSALQRFFVAIGAYGEESFPNQIADPVFVSKVRLKSCFKGTINQDGKGFGIDFLRGNIYVNSSWAKTLPGLPLNAQGMVSISIEDVANPDQRGAYFIDGARVEITHREALGIVLNKVRTELFLPEDAEENLITLAQCTPALYREFFTQPMPLIKAAYPDLLIINKKMQMFDMGPSTDASEAARDGFLALVDAFSANDPEAPAKAAAFRKKLEG